MAGVDAGHGARPRRRTRPEGCQLPVAHHPRRGVLGVLARGHRRISRQRRHRDGIRAVPRGDRRRVPGAGVRTGGARRHRAAVAVAGAPRPPRRLAHRRRDRTRRVHRDGARQRVHQPDGRAQPAHRGRRRAPGTPTRGRSWAWTPRRWRPGATPRTPCTSPTTRSWVFTRSATGSRRCASGTSPTNTQYPLLLHATLRAALPRPGHQAGRPGARDAVAEPRVHRRSRRPATSTTTSGARRGTRRCRRAPRR